MGDEVILKEGTPSMFRVYRLTSGSCRVTKFVPNRGDDEPESVDLGILQEGALLGEMSFFTNVSASATVTAASLVRLQIIDGQFLRITAKKNPILVLKFFFAACVNLSKCIHARKAAGWTRFERIVGER